MSTPTNESVQTQSIPEGEAHPNDETIQNIDPSKRQRLVRRTIGGLTAVALVGGMGLAGDKLMRFWQHHNLSSRENILQSNLNKRNFQYLRVGEHGSGLVVELTQNKEDPNACTITLPTTDKGVIQSDITADGIEEIASGKIQTADQEANLFSTLKSLPGYECHPTLIGQTSSGHQGTASSRTP